MIECNERHSCRPEASPGSLSKRLRLRHYLGAAARARNEYAAKLRANGEELPADVHAHHQAVEHLLLLGAEKSQQG